MGKMGLNWLPKMKQKLQRECYVETPDVGYFTLLSDLCDWQEKKPEDFACIFWSRIQQLAMAWKTPQSGLFYAAWYAELL